MKTLDLLTLVLVMWLAVAGLAGASSGVERPREAMASGTTSASVGSVTLQGTVGQPLVGVRIVSDVQLSHGFWRGQGARYVIHIPVVFKEQP
jgi:hypothetical protein